MTEEQWLTCADPARMVKSLASILKKTKAFPTTDSQFRRCRLFAVTVCRRLWTQLHANNQRAVKLAEEYADSKDKKLLLDAVRAYRAGDPHSETAEQDYDRVPDLATEYRSWAESEVGEAIKLLVNGRASVAAGAHNRAIRAWGLLESADQLGGKIEPLRPVDRAPQSATEAALQVAWLRDIFGNPFRPVTFSPDWRTDTAIALARTMYESREFGAMPILADALQDAGCDNADILNHCRDTAQVHVRGCWVCDLVLGKA